MLILKRFARDTRGATAVEYTLLLSCLMLAILVAIGLLGTRLNSIFTRLGTSLT